MENSLEITMKTEKDTIVVVEKLTLNRPIPGFGAVYEFSTVDVDTARVINQTGGE